MSSSHVPAPPVERKAHEPSPQAAASGVLVTGASGFVGHALVERLRREGRAVHATMRRASNMPAGTQVILGLPLDAHTDWRAALTGIDTVVHCAARAHVLHETADDPLAAFRQVNVLGTLALARQAAQARVRRFIFISSIGVHGAQTDGRPFRFDDAPAPHSPYAQSKWEAEQALQALARETALQVVVIRPPLVFGPGAPGNFERLMRAVHAGLPLPFGAIHNRRSLVALDNLCDLISLCIDHPAAAGQTFLVSDGEDISTTDLLRRTGQALGKSARLLPVPGSWMAATARIFGRRAFAQRLLSSLQVDMAHTQQQLGWAPPARLDDVLRQTAQQYLQQVSRP